MVTSNRKDDHFILANPTLPRNRESVPKMPSKRKPENHLPSINIAHGWEEGNKNPAKSVVLVKTFQSCEAPAPPLGIDSARAQVNICHRPWRDMIRIKFMEVDGTIEAGPSSSRAFLQGNFGCFFSTTTECWFVEESTIFSIQLKELMNTC